MGVGCGVCVGSGVFNSMTGGWSPRIGDSLVGSTENIPGGGADVGSGPCAASPQASIASRTTAVTTILKKVAPFPRPVFRSAISSIHPSPIW